MAANTGILRRPLAPTGVWSWMTTVDHKKIGILYGVTAFFFFLLGGLEALLMRVQLANADSTLIDSNTFNSLFTMHGTTMVFMVVMPAGAAFFNFVVPLMIGARDVAFPRLNAMSYWVFLFGALFMNFSFFVNNLADCLISLGVLGFLITLLRERKKKWNQEQELSKNVVYFFKMFKISKISNFFHGF
mgnify:CR=1 FL=1